MRTRRSFRKIDGKYIVTELVLIVVGILLAINLNTWTNNRKLDAESRTSLEKIRNEAERNIEELEESLSSGESVQNLYTAFITLQEEADTASVEYVTAELESMVAEYGDQLGIRPEDVGQTARALGDVTLPFDLELAELNDIAWQAAKLSNTVNQFEYDCLAELLSIYNLQGLFLTEQSKLIDTIAEQDLNKLRIVLNIGLQLGNELKARYQSLLNEENACRV